MSRGYCQCRRPSPSAQHHSCINDGCDKEIETIQGKHNKAKKEISLLKKEKAVLLEAVELVCNDECDDMVCSQYARLKDEASIALEKLKEIRKD